MWNRLPEIKRCEKSAGLGLGGLLALTQVALGRRDALCPGQVVSTCLQHWHLLDSDYFAPAQL